MLRRRRQKQREEEVYRVDDGAAAAEQRGRPRSPVEQAEPEVDFRQSRVMESMRRSQRIVELKDLINDQATASQKNFFDVLASTTDEINELEEQESADLREQLRPLKLSELRKRAAKLHVDEDEIEETMDSGENPKEALIDMVIARHRELFEELDALELADVEARVVEQEALTEDEIEDAVARHGDNAKQALIALLLGRDDWDELTPSGPTSATASPGAAAAAGSGGDSTPDWRVQMAMAMDEVSGEAAETFDVPLPSEPTRKGKKSRFSFRGKKHSAGRGDATAAAAAAAATAEARAAAMQAQVLLAADRIDGRPPVKEGYLKMGGVRRWFELRSGCVLFFLSERGGDLQGNILFAEAIVIMVDDETTTGRHCFDVITPNLFKYRLEATSKDLRDAWLDAVLLQQSERGAMLRGSLGVPAEMRSGAADDGRTGASNANHTPAQRGRRRGGDTTDEPDATGGNKPPVKKSLSKRELAQLQEQERRLAREEKRKRKKAAAEEGAAAAAAKAKADADAQKAAEAEAASLATMQAEVELEPEPEPEPELEPEPDTEPEPALELPSRERTRERRHRRTGSGGGSSTSSTVGGTKHERRHRRTRSDTSLTQTNGLHGTATGNAGEGDYQLATVTSGEVLDESTVPQGGASMDTARDGRAVDASASQVPLASRPPLDGAVVASSGGRGNGNGAAAGGRNGAGGMGTRTGGGGGGGGGGKFRVLVEAHASVSDQQFVVMVKCIYDTMKGDQPPNEAALVAELIDEALENVDKAVQPQVVDLLRNLLQKALKSSKVLKAQRSGRSLHELRPRLEPLGFPDSFIRAFAGVFDQLDVRVPAERDRGDRSRRRTPPQTVAEGVPPRQLRLAPADAPSGAGGGGISAVDGDAPVVVNEVGAGTALLSQLAATKKMAADEKLQAAKLVQYGDREEDPMTWLTKPRPAGGAKLPGLANLLPSTQVDNDDDALSFFVAAGQ